MIRFVTTRRNRSNVEQFLRYWMWRDPLMRWMEHLYYPDLWKEQPPGLYIFTDLDLLSARERNRLSRLADRLRKDPEHYTLLNHPVRFLERMDLLKRLARDQINPFQVYPKLRVTKETQWPIFVRQRYDGMSNPSELVPDREALEALIPTLPGKRRSWFATEFCDTRDDEGVFRKYGAFCVGDRVIPRHMHHSSRWMVKYPDERSAARYEEELRFVKSSQFADQIRLIFRMSGLDYGRMDFSVKGGKPVVWEINSNPVIMDVRDHDPEREELVWTFYRRLLDALQHLLPTAIEEGRSEPREAAALRG